MSTLPAPRRNVWRYRVNWDAAHRALLAEPNQWVLLASDVPAEFVSRLRKGRYCGPLSQLHPHVEYALRESRRAYSSKRWIGRLWAYYTPGVESAFATRARLRSEADRQAALIAPTYPEIPKIADL